MYRCQAITSLKLSIVYIIIAGHQSRVRSNVQLLECLAQLAVVIVWAESVEAGVSEDECQQWVEYKVVEDPSNCQSRQPTSLEYSTSIAAGSIVREEAAAAC